MKTHVLPAFLPFIMLLWATNPCSSQPPSTIDRPAVADTGTFFLYVNYCGRQYNRSMQQHEWVITALKLPAHMLKQLPRLKNESPYSARNRRIYLKQQEIISQYADRKLVVKVNRKKFNNFYPNGLKKGEIIDQLEFDRWNFREIPVTPPPPGQQHWDEYDYRKWRVTDPMNIKYKMIMST